MRSINQPNRQRTGPPAEKHNIAMSMRPETLDTRNEPIQNSNRINEFVWNVRRVPVDRPLLQRLNMNSTLMSKHVGHRKNAIIHHLPMNEN